MISSTTVTPPPAISLRQLFGRFKGRISFTLLLVLGEAGLELLFPLFIGFAINSVIDESYTGLLALALLGLLALLVGGGRRFYDTRAYAGIYTILSTEMVTREENKGSTVSAIAARSSLLTELVEFLENSMPAVLSSMIGLFGILIIIFTLDLAVFGACVALFLLMLAVYALSGKLNYRLNRGFNDALEKQVDVIASQDQRLIHNHFQTIMRWNIRLSDLETVNYVVIWLGIIGLLVFSPLSVVSGGVTNYGLILAILMYVFQYIESLVSLPLFIQQTIRLQEIMQRLEN